MILISNNLQKYMNLPIEVVIRINMAWVNNIEDLEKIIIENKDRKIYLDYPQNRKKFPRPILKIEDGYVLCQKFENIKYFAVSNIEDVDNVKTIQANLPSRVEFVPKIETLNGIKNLGTLIYECNLHYIMLDKEDLLIDVDSNNEEFFKCVKHIEGICAGLRVTLLELQGVTFIGDEYGT